MSNKTPIDWLVEMLDIDTSDSSTKETIQEARDMFKEYIIDSIIYSEKAHYFRGPVWPLQKVLDKAEAYYNETFEETKK